MTEDPKECESKTLDTNEESPDNDDADIDASGDERGCSDGQEDDGENAPDEDHQEKESNNDEEQSNLNSPLPKSTGVDSSVTATPVSAISTGQRDNQHSMTPGTNTPVGHPPQVPIQPYAYPPYAYYPPMPGYAPPTSAGIASSALMPNSGGAGFLTGSTNPYQYTDVSNLGDPQPDTRRNRGGVTEPFPSKLHRMLEYAECEGLADVVSFFSHGRAFAIHKPRRFVTEIMNKFFRQTRLTSFQRQLNLYGTYFRSMNVGLFDPKY